MSDEIDWKHPELQSLLRLNARMKIILQIAEDVVNNPEYEPTALDMEYWGPLHERLLALVENERNK